MSVLEIESNQPLVVDLPIASFPPFKLRSSMVDKDPVIWVHLIEVYIQYVQTVLQLKIPLTVRSEQQLALFVKAYLHEISWEQGQILSLGLINVQITENLEILRKWMFELIKQFGVLRLKLNGEGLWDFAKIYGLKNAATAKGLIDGSLKPRDKTTINSISLVQKHIEHLIGNSKFDSYDIKTLAALLSNSKKSQSSSNVVRSTQKTVRKNSARDQSTLFAEKFVNVQWMELLEKFYAKGEGLFAKLCQKLALLSLTNLNADKIAVLATELGATSLHLLTLYPLFAGVITNAKFQQTTPGLEKKLPFLVKRSPRIEVNPDDVETLIELFPNLTVSHTESLLRKYKNDVEQVTHLLLESPEAAIEKQKEETQNGKGNSNQLDIAQKRVIGKRKAHVPDENRNKSLAATLKLIYEADEDERDDTYDEAEAASSTSNTELDSIEKFLWDLFKKDQTLFERTQRKSRTRKEMKEQTKWSDEQIEGWARMLQKSPKRVKILEEKYLFRGNKPWNSRFSKLNDAEKTNSSKEDIGENKNPKGSKDDQKPQQSSNDKNKNKQQQARNEKNKSSRANHSRKSGHDKKMARGFN